jgi:hypothetical protein
MHDRACSECMHDRACSDVCKRPCLLLHDCTGANDQQTMLQQKQKQLEESKQDLARMQEVEEPTRL